MLVFMPGVITAAISVRSCLAHACQMWEPQSQMVSSEALIWEHVNFSTNESCPSSDFILTQNVFASPSGCSDQLWC